MSTDSNSTNATGTPSPGNEREVLLKTAFNAFKKRYKLTKLDHESHLGAARPMTSGKSAAGIGINPPSQFPREVWQELAKQGKIRDMGGGFYSM